MDITDALEGTSVGVKPFTFSRPLGQRLTMLVSHHQTQDLAHEIFLSQAHMMQAVDALARRVDALAAKLTGDSQMPLTR